MVIGVLIMKNSKGYNMTSEELRAVQLVELELLCEVDRICRKCGITYRIVAGTLLGAVRHGGFIPWDDDADVAFLREEYEQFRAVCETELDTSRFYFQDHRNTLGYRWGYGKLRRKGTEFIRLNQEHMPYEQGILLICFLMTMFRIICSYGTCIVLNASCIVRLFGHRWG